MKGDWVPHYFGWHYLPNRAVAVAARRDPRLLRAARHVDRSHRRHPARRLSVQAVRPGCPSRSSTSGLWWLLCFTLQGALRRAAGRAGARRRRCVQALGAALFVLMPTLLARVGHAALCAHWLMLWALLVAPRARQRRDSRRRSGRRWACGRADRSRIWRRWCCRCWRRRRSPTRGDAPRAAAARRSAAAVVATLTGWWLSGLFVLQRRGIAGRPAGSATTR